MTACELGDDYETSFFCRHSLTWYHLWFFHVSGGGLKSNSRSRSIPLCPRAAPLEAGPRNSNISNRLSRGQEEGSARSDYLRPTSWQVSTSQQKTLSLETVSGSSFFSCSLRTQRFTSNHWLCRSKTIHETSRSPGVCGVSVTRRVGPREHQVFSQRLC